MLITDASHLNRIMPCNGSLLMQPDPILTEQDNTIREEGNAAHWLASVVFSGQHTTLEMVDRKAPNGVYITAEMADHVNEYVSAVGLGANVEWPYTLQGDNWQVNGRADTITWQCHPNDQHEQPFKLFIDDFKYGYSIVNPLKNWTMISHAIGYCITNQMSPPHIIFRIHQPRAPHRDGTVREWEITYPELLQLYDTMSRTLANPSNILQTGLHCYKCPAFKSCPARQDAELNGIEAAHLAYNAEISDDDLSSRLDLINRAMEMLTQAQKAYQETALHRIKSGSVVKNYASENALSNTAFKKHVTPELLDVLYGKLELCKRKLPTVKEAKTALGEAAVSTLTDRFPTGTKLIRIDADKEAKKRFGKKES